MFRVTRISRVKRVSRLVMRIADNNIAEIRPTHSNELPKAPSHSITVLTVKANNPNILNNPKSPFNFTFKEAKAGAGEISTDWQSVVPGTPSTVVVCVHA
jgi:hypothetical protein